MYIDPGSGSVILQAVLGILLTLLVFARLFWSRIKAFLGKQAPATSEIKED